MTRTSGIDHPPKQQLVIIREDYVELCQPAADAEPPVDPNCAAALMNLFEFMTNWKRENSTQAKKQNDIMEAGDLERTQDEGLWIWKTNAELKSDLMNLWGDTKISNARKWLVEQGFLFQRRNPKHKWDRTYHYFYDMQAVNLRLQSLRNNETIPKTTLIERKDSLSAKPISGPREIETEPTKENNTYVGKGEGAEVEHDPFVNHNESGESVPILDGLDLPTPDITPTSLTKREWAVLGGAMWHKNKWLSIIRSDETWLPRFVAAKLVIALKTRHKLTDAGFNWVGRYIPLEHKQACADEHEAAKRRAKEKQARKDARRLEPPKPKGKKQVTPQIEPLFNMINTCWKSKDDKPLMKTEHNNRVDLAWEVYHANGTPDEIRAVYELGVENNWTTGTPNTLRKHLSTVRGKKENGTARQLPPLPAPAPLDPSEGIAYTEQEND